MDNPHFGHRKRVRDEFLSSGLESFSDVRALEMLLFYGIERIDVNPLAHSLLDHFGSLKNVFSATIDELKLVKGISDYTACLIRLVGDLNRKAEIDAVSHSVFTSVEDAVKVITPYFSFSRDEKFYIFLLNSENVLLRGVCISQGVVDSVNIDIRKIVETALSAKSSSVILSHNHPSGNEYPSEDDIFVTSKIQDALALLRIRVLDHIIIGDNYYSFAQHNLLS